MSLLSFIFFMLGALLEILWLWDDAHPQTGLPKGSRLLAGTFGRVQWIQAGLCAAAGLLAAVVYLLGAAQVRVSLDDGLVFVIFVALGLFVLAFGVVADGLLPRVSEKSILMVLLLVILNNLAGGGNNPALPLLLALPAAVLIYLMFSTRALPPLAKAAVYLVYLAALLVNAMQAGALEGFSAADFTPGEALVFGIAFIFLLLHGLFAIRFFLIVSSLALPRNWPLVRQVMPRLFADEQMPPWRFGLFALALGGLLLLNDATGLVPRAALLNLALMASVQLFFNPRQNARRQIG